MFISVSNPVQFRISTQLSVACHKFSKPSWFRSLLCTRPKLENTRSIAVELDGRWSSFSAVLIRGGDTFHLQFATDVHHATGDIWSTHADDRSEAGNRCEPAVNAHRSAITSGCSGRSFRSSCHAASDNCFPLYFGCSKFARKWLSVTASLKHCITVVKCGFSASALRRLSHSSQASVIVALSDCNLSNAFATGWSYIYPFSIYGYIVLWKIKHNALYCLLQTGSEGKKVVET